MLVTDIYVGTFGAVGITQRQKVFTELSLSIATYLLTVDL